MHEMENARQLLTYARTFFKGSLKTSNKIFSSSYGVASETRKQRRIACAKKSGYVLSKLREHDTRKSLHILYSCFPQDRAGNCCEYVDVAINHGVKLQVPNIWSVIHDLHQLLVLANTPGFNISTLSEFKRYEDNDFWVCDPWFNIHCRMHLYGLMIVSKSSQWQHEGKEIYLDNGTAEPASMLYPRLSLEKIEFTQMTDHEGKATNGWEQRLSSKLTFLPS